MGRMCQINRKMLLCAHLQEFSLVRDLTQWRSCVNFRFVSNWIFVSACVIYYNFTDQVSIIKFQKIYNIKIIKKLKIFGLHGSFFNMAIYIHTIFFGCIYWSKGSRASLKPGIYNIIQAGQKNQGLFWFINY